MVALFQKVFGEGRKLIQSSSPSSIVMWPYVFRLFFSALFCLPAKILKHPLFRLRILIHEVSNGDIFPLEVIQKVPPKAAKGSA